MEKALELISMGNVHKIVDAENRYVVEGKTSKYLVMLPDFCSCDHFVFRCLKEAKKVCYHILAAKHSNKPKSIENVDLIQFFIN